jgi:hypothetical protein
MGLKTPYKSIIEWVEYPGNDGRKNAVSKIIAMNYLRRLGYDFDQITAILEKLAARKTPIGDVMKALKMIGEDLFKKHAKN